MPGLASRYMYEPIGRETAAATPGRWDFAGSEAGRSPLPPPSIRCAAKPASTSGPLSNSTKFTLYEAPASACDEANRVSKSCCLSPTLRTTLADPDAPPGDDLCAAWLGAHAETSAMRPVTDRPETVLMMKCEVRRCTVSPRGPRGGISEHC